MLDPTDRSRAVVVGLMIFRSGLVILVASIALVIELICFGNHGPSRVIFDLIRLDELDPYFGLHLPAVGILLTVVGLGTMWAFPDDKHRRERIRASYMALALLLVMIPVFLFILALAAR